MMRASKFLPVFIIACVMGASIGAYAEGSAVPMPAAPQPMDLPIEGDMPSLSAATGWLNSQPLTPASLRGKVVLVDFWTYSCINSIRQLPYLRAWARKYKNQGLVVIGVHSPEFAFEKNLDNVRRAVTDLRVGSPMATAIDSDHRIWQAFDNAYWPAIYIVDAHGRIRHHVFGEGEYEQTERVIQQLLAEAGARNVDQALVSGDGKGIEAAPDLADLKSPETYVGSERSENFASKGGSLFSSHGVYSAPEPLSLNHWALVGDWTIGKHSAALNKVGGRIVYRFHARDLHLVMGPTAKGAAVAFRVLINGKPPGDAHGIDVDERGNGTVSEQRLYQLIRQPGPVTDQEFQIEFLDPGVEAFVFTFG